jgi:hypothetical protein
LRSFILIIIHDDICNMVVQIHLEYMFINFNIFHYISENT